MAVTGSYQFDTNKSEFIVAYSAGNLELAADERAPAITALSDGGYAVAYESNLVDSPDQRTIILERYTADGTLRASSQFLGASYVDTFSIAGAPADPSITQLAGGNILTTWTETDGIHYAITALADGAVISPDTLLAETIQKYSISDVAALPSGGFVVVTQIEFATVDNDAKLLFYDATGAFATATRMNRMSILDEQAPAVAVLSNGNVAVAYERELIENSDTFGMAIEVFTQTGATVLESTLFDGIGSQNRRPDILALSGGGFAVGYEDNGYGQEGLTVAFFDADGTLRGSVRADGGLFSDNDVKLSRLANSYVVASWTDNGVDIVASVIDPATMTRLSGPIIIEGQNGQQEQSSVAALSNGTFVTAWADFNSAIDDGNTDPNGQHVSMQIDVLERVSDGDALANAIVGDELTDVMNGNAGNDTLSGKGGGDSLSGGLGADILNGGAGADQFFGGEGNDLADYSAALVSVRAALDASAAGTGDAAGDTFNSVENLKGANIAGGVDRLTGNSADNTIFGNAGNDIINGRGGLDKLVGGLGTDIMRGELGNDEFVYFALAEAGDTIADFTSNAAGNNDVFKFKGTAFGGLAAGALAANQFEANAAGAATLGTTRFVYDTDDEILRFDANGAAAGGATAIATLQNGAVLVIGDISIF